MRSASASGLLALGAMCLVAGCGRSTIDRVEWPVMGTVAAVQVRGRSITAESGRIVADTMAVFKDVADALNAHDPRSELSRLAPLDDSAICVTCDARMKPCYEAAFKLRRESGGAFNPRWRGTNTFDLGAIAKGFAVDLSTDGVAATDGALVDLGGTVKSVRGTWKTGIKDPAGDGFAAVVDLHEGEALATSATYYRGSHIYDGRTGLAVSNGVASVTVLCKSAMWADGLSTTLFVLGPEEGRKFLDDKVAALVGDREVSALWIMDGGRQEIYGNVRFQGN